MKNISQRNIFYLIPQLAIFFLVALLFKVIGITQYWLLSLSLYLLMNGYLKVVIPKWHRKGLFYLRKGEMDGAIFAFEKSYDFFSKYNWLDKYRAFTLLSISKFSYCEMALMNIIYCYQQKGDNNKVKSTQKKLTIKFPENPYVRR
jgi:hypothetical protein